MALPFRPQGNCPVGLSKSLISRNVCCCLSASVGVISLLESQLGRCHSKLWRHPRNVVSVTPKVPGESYQSLGFDTQEITAETTIAALVEKNRTPIKRGSVLRNSNKEYMKYFTVALPTVGIVRRSIIAK
jgi:hypothetical protein